MRKMIHMLLLASLLFSLALTGHAAQTEASLADVTAQPGELIHMTLQLPEDIREEVTPKNILMIGPTGVGKTEIARRLAKLVDAPFVKVEATKFTEVGYVGRDVESIIRDLVEASIRLVKGQHAERVRIRAQANVEDRLVELLSGAQKRKPANPIDILLGNKPKQPELSPEDRDKLAVRQDDVRTRLRRGELEREIVEIFKLLGDGSGETSKN